MMNEVDEQFIGKFKYIINWSEIINNQIISVDFANKYMKHFCNTKDNRRISIRDLKADNKSGLVVVAEVYGIPKKPKVYDIYFMSKAKYETLIDEPQYVDITERCDMFSYKHIADDDLPDYDTLNYYTSSVFTTYNE